MREQKKNAEILLTKTSCKHLPARLLLLMGNATLGRDYISNHADVGNDSATATPVRSVKRDSRIIRGSSSSVPKPRSTRMYRQDTLQYHTWRATRKRKQFSAAMF